VFLSILTVILTIRLAMNPTTRDDRQSTPAPLADQLADRVDPNIATAAELAAIPELGEKRAESITAFRDRYKLRHPGKLAFARLDDLLQISGIGAATAENIEPYLYFPTATTRP
jgi:competence protein ComEA